MDARICFVSGTGARQGVNRVGLVSAVTLLTFAFAGAASAAVTPESKSVAKCQAVVTKQAGKYVAAQIKMIGKCLTSIAGELVEDGEADSAGAAKKCIASFAKLVNSGDPTKSLQGKFAAKIDKACDPAVNSRLAHDVADILGAGAQQLGAQSLMVRCSMLGIPAPLDSYEKWKACLAASADCDARNSVASQFPRVLEFLGDVRGPIAALDPGASDPKVVDALAALDAIDAAIEGDTDDDQPDISCGARSLDFSDASLNSWDLRGKNLAGWNFSGSTVDLFDLRDANLTGALLQGTALHDSDLRGANFTAAVMQDISLNGSNLAGQDLRVAAVFSPVAGSGANFSGAILPPRVLASGWNDADFSDAVLDGSTLAGLFKRVDFRGADLSNAIFGDDLGAPIQRFDGARFDGANLTGASFRGTDLTGAFLDNDVSVADFTGAKFDHVTFGSGMVLAGLDLSDTLLSNELQSVVGDGVDFSGSTIFLVSSGSFVNADLSDVVVEFGGLTDVNMAGANLTGATLMNGAAVGLSDFTNAQLIGTVFVDIFFFVENDLTGADLTNADFSGITTFAANVLDDTTCPDGTNSTANGGTCCGHFLPGKGPFDCS